MIPGINNPVTNIFNRKILRHGIVRYGYCLGFTIRCLSFFMVLFLTGGIVVEFIIEIIGFLLCLFHMLCLFLPGLLELWRASFADYAFVVQKPKEPRNERGKTFTVDTDQSKQSKRKRSNTGNNDFCCQGYVDFEQRKDTYSGNRAGFNDIAKLKHTAHDSTGIHKVFGDSVDIPFFSLSCHRRHLHPGTMTGCQRNLPPALFGLPSDRIHPRLYSHCRHKQPYNKHGYTVSVPR